MLEKDGKTGGKQRDLLTSIQGYHQRTILLYTACNISGAISQTNSTYNMFLLSNALY